MNTRILTVTNQKGGVGKTTSVFNLAAAFAQQGYKVVAIDLDSQSNLTKSFLEAEPAKTFYTYISATKEGHGNCTADDILLEVQDRLWLVPCNANFSSFDAQYGTDFDATFFIDEFIEESLVPQLAPDFVLIDTPPALGMATINGLIASSEVYVPMNAQEYVRDALSRLVDSIQKLNKRFKLQIEIKGLFFTRHNPRTTLARQIANMLEQEFPGLLMDTYIRRNIALEEAPSVREDIFTYNPKSNGAIDYQTLANEIFKQAAP